MNSEARVRRRRVFLFGYLVALLAGINVQATAPKTAEADIFRGAPENTVLTGHVYRQIRGKSRPYCGAVCSKNAAECFSFNYCGDTKLCELNHAKAAKFRQDMKGKANCSYYDIIAECEIVRDADHAYHYIQMVVDVTRIEFSIMGDRDAFVGLSPVAANDPKMYELVIGGHADRKVFLRACKDCINEKSTDIEDLLSATEFHGFWVSYDYPTGRFAAGKAGESSPFIEWVNPTPYDVKYVGFKSPGNMVAFRYLCSI